MAKVAKKTTRTRRRDRKNIEKGAAHIRSTFNNSITQSLQLQIQLVMLYLGQVPAV
jgi:small subunit ribosomal protein S11